MIRTTPRPLDIEAEFPEVAGHRKVCTRLHPRPGSPNPDQSSVGGPFLWPADEPWPVCREPHVPGSDDTGPVPLVPLAQLFARDVPGLLVPAGRDLVQVLWCPFDAHGTPPGPDVRLVWRASAEIGELLADPPLPVGVGDNGHVPEPCVLAPEQVMEHEWAELLPADLRRRIAEWEEELWEAAGEGAGDEDEPLSYDGDFSVAPGWKAGGYSAWGATGPRRLGCPCGSPMELLLTVASAEWGGILSSWTPFEDRAPTVTHGLNVPTPGEGRQRRAPRCLRLLGRPHP